MRERTIDKHLGIAHPAGDYWNSRAVSAPTPVCPKLRLRRSLGPKSVFFWTVHGPFSLTPSKKMGGASPAFL